VNDGVQAVDPVEVEDGLLLVLRLDHQVCTRRSQQRIRESRRRTTHRCRRADAPANAGSGPRVRDVPAQTIPSAFTSHSLVGVSRTHHDSLSALPRLRKMKLGLDALSVPGCEDARNEFLGRVGRRVDAVVVEVCAMLESQKRWGRRKSGETNRRREGCLVPRRAGGGRRRCSRSRRSPAQDCEREERGSQLKTGTG
jgi:hypothetical protein